MNYLDQIEEIENLEVKRNVDLTSYTTFRLASRGDLIEVNHPNALLKLLPLLKKLNKKYILVGWGANQILPASCEEIVIHLSFPFEKNYLDDLKSEYELPASLGLNVLTAHAIKFGLKGWEVFTGIPASLGGAIYMNAGTNLGEIGNLIESVKIVTSDGKIREEIIHERSFSYRKNHFVSEGEVIISAKLKHFGVDPEISKKIKDYMEYRRNSQPLTTKNCGCVFKNPLIGFQAGRLIDSIGLKSLQVGQLKISQKHANFMENHGAADWESFSTLVDTVRFYMDKFYGFEFELEVKIPYDF